MGKGLRLVGLVLALGACGGVRVTNVEPARELARATAGPPPAALYMGWRVFQQRCAGCHGSAAEGMSGGGPDLRVSLREMGPRRFVEIVLRRYPGALPSRSSIEPGKRIEEILQRRADAMVQMPAWGGDPVVEAHVMDLYEYLAGRADGRFGPEAPKRP